MSAYAVVEQFEKELCNYTGARYAVTTNSCTSALFLAIRYHVEMHGELFYDSDGDPYIECEKRTYCSVPMQIRHAGGFIRWRDENWHGAYKLDPLPVWDSARRFRAGMYEDFGREYVRDQLTKKFYDVGAFGQFVCVSFQTSKILGLEQGGAILFDRPEADAWFRRARFDGRLNAEEKLPQQQGWHMYLNSTTAALGLARLACLPRDNPDQAGAQDFADLSELPCFR